MLITMGDPAGIGPEVLLRSLSRLRTRVPVEIIGDLSWLESVARRGRIRVPWSRFRWVDLRTVPRGLRLGKVRPEAGRAAFDCLEEAVRRLKGREAAALVTGPVSKEAIVRAGIPWIGHTEYLGARFARRPVMMFVTGRFRAALATTHCPLQEVAGRLTVAGVSGVLRAVRHSLVKEFGLKSPRVGLCALNPHGGEGGIFGREEKRILLPAAKAAGPWAKGPVPSDSLMRDALRGAYDAVVALYHDQALIPVKIAGWEQAINVSLGLPFVRTSPVHGTAFDIAGRRPADHRSMLSAIHLALQLSRRRCR